MNKGFDVAVIGAGPAGLAAATRASRLGLSVIVFDEQPTPGGQIWRSVEARATGPVGDVLGTDYQNGLKRVSEFRKCGATYVSGARVWQIEPGWTVFASKDGKANSLTANRILVATGAQERPAPFPGWTTPGVMTVGAAQIVLKSSGQIPEEPVWIAGSGPLPLLYISQLLRAGGSVAGWLDTTPSGAVKRATPHLIQGLAGWRDLAKGLKWICELNRAKVVVKRNISTLRAFSGVDGHLAHIEYTTAGGRQNRVPARLLLVHEGVVPSIHVTQMLGCKHAWHSRQCCLVPEIDEWSRTSVPGIFVAGDGGGIGGAAAASTQGELAAIGIALDLNRLTPLKAEAFANPLRLQLSKQLAPRSMLEAIYQPRAEIAHPPDETVVCRCEEITARQVRVAAQSGTPSPDRIKSLTRAGMGPCQGRQCGYTISHILASTQNVPVSEIGFYRVRPPLKPLTLGELAALDNNESSNTTA